MSPKSGCTRSMKRMQLVVVSFLIVGLYAADPPTIKEGLWSIHTTSIDNPGNKKSEGTALFAATIKYDNRIRQQSENKQKQICKTFTETSTGNTLTAESECNVRGSVAKSKTVTTFSGDSSIHAETHATYTPAMFGTAESTLILEQKYVCACPAGVEPVKFRSIPTPAGLGASVGRDLPFPSGRMSEGSNINLGPSSFVRCICHPFSIRGELRHVCTRIAGKPSFRRFIRTIGTNLKNGALAIPEQDEFTVRRPRRVLDRLLRRVNNLFRLCARRFPDTKPG